MMNEFRFELSQDFDIFLDGQAVLRFERIEGAERFLNHLPCQGAEGQRIRVRRKDKNLTIVELSTAGRIIDSRIEIDRIVHCPSGSHQFRHYAYASDCFRKSCANNKLAPRRISPNGHSARSAMSSSVCFPSDKFRTQSIASSSTSLCVPPTERYRPRFPS